MPGYTLLLVSVAVSVTYSQQLYDFTAPTYQLSFAAHIETMRENNLTVRNRNSVEQRIASAIITNVVCMV